MNQRQVQMQVQVQEKPMSGTSDDKVKQLLRKMDDKQVIDLVDFLFQGYEEE